MSDEFTFTLHHDGKLRTCVIVFRLKPLTQLMKHVTKAKLYSDADVDKVMQLGYAKNVAVYALEACHGDVNSACNMLLEYGLDCCLPLALAWIGYSVCSSIDMSVSVFLSIAICLSVSLSVCMSVCL